MGRRMKFLRGYKEGERERERDRDGAYKEMTEARPESEK